jgi:hypothetical protein
MREVESITGVDPRDKRRGDGGKIRQEKNTEKVGTFDRLWIRRYGEATEGEIML